ncbi:MAG: hypothetical protein HYU39_02370 [Thaumarchaeota archaeon]|nr:hypothetical protein [Nitrososphaerota archaeon]
MQSSPPQANDVAIGIDAEVLKCHEELFLLPRASQVKVLSEYNTQTALLHLRQVSHFKLEELKDQPIVRAFRDFYWRIGVDPTKVRPASEALVRRFLSSGVLPKINSVVDAGNFASIETLIPIGIYDMAHMHGQTVLRKAKTGESMVDISGVERKLDSGDIVLADEAGPLHIFPHRDSRRTMVTLRTNRVLVVGCGVKGVDASLVSRAVSRTLDLIAEFAH